MSQDYFYFISGLPNLSFEDSKLTYTVEQFRTDAKLQLNAKDYAYLEILHIPAEFETLLNLLYKNGKDANSESLYSVDYWEQYLAFLRMLLDNHDLETPAQYAHIPEFISQILMQALSQEDIQPFIKTEHDLIAGFYMWTANHSNKFIQKWFAYDAHMRNILSAINGRKFGLPFTQYLVGENDSVEHLAKSHAADFGLGKDDILFDSLNRIYEQNNILYRERNYDILRWKWIDSTNFFNYFNIDHVLGYYCKLRILSRWLKADPNYGKEVFHDILNTLENSFSFPEEFNIKSIRK
jgi:hypothetical protein